MSRGRLPQPLRGIVPPLVTPLADAETLDRKGLERLVEHVLAGGVAGLFILGTTGEGPSLSYRLRQQTIDVVVEQVAGRVPVLVGITDTSYDESLSLAGYAADAGAQAVVLAPPCYYPAGQKDLARYLRRLAAACPLPLVLYNMPSHTKLPLHLDTVAQVLDTPNVVGMKDSSGDMVYFHQARRLTRQRPDWTLLVGPEELLAEAVLFGGDGGVCGGANVFPELYVAVYNAARAGQLDRLRALHDQVMRVASALYTLGSPGAAVTQGIKAALAVLGICNDRMAEPFAALDPDLRRVVEQRVRELRKECADLMGLVAA